LHNLASITYMLDYDVNGLTRSHFKTSDIWRSHLGRLMNSYALSQ